MQEIIIIIGLFIALIISLSLVHRLYSKIEKVQKDNLDMRFEFDEKMKKADKKMKEAIDLFNKNKKDADELVSIDKGDRAIIPDYALKTVETNESFKVTYEVEILEVSMDKVKINIIDFISTDKFANDPTNKSSIIKFLQNKWVSKKEIELIIDDATRRDRKLQQILD